MRLSGGQYLSGTIVEAPGITVEAEKLFVASVLDQSESHLRGLNLDSSGVFGLQYADADSHWIQFPSGFYATQHLNVTIGQDLELIGAVLSGPDGHTHIQTDRFCYRHLDEGQSGTSFNAALSFAWDPNAMDAGSLISGSIEVNYQKTSQSGMTHASVVGSRQGLEGEWVDALDIKDLENSDDLSNLNRNPNHIQTRSNKHATHVRVYLPVADVRGMIENWKAVRNQLFASSETDLDLEAIYAAVAGGGVVFDVDESLEHADGEWIEEGHGVGDDNDEIIAGGDFALYDVTDLDESELLAIRQLVDCTTYDGAHEPVIVRDQYAVNGHVFERLVIPSEGVMDGVGDDDYHLTYNAIADHLMFAYVNGDQSIILEGESEDWASAFSHLTFKDLQNIRADDLKALGGMIWNELKDIWLQPIRPDVVADEMPILGDMKAVFEAMVGRKVISGESLTASDRLIHAGSGVIGLLATAALKQGGAPAGPVLRAVLEGAEGAEKIEATKNVLENIGKKVMALFGQGKGPVYGTRVHSAISKEVNDLSLSYLKSERPLLPSGFKKVMQKGGIRLDVVLFDPENAGKVLAVFDFKTGSAKLTPKRIHQIKSFLPKGSEGARIVEIKL